jgi:hypothetical protein
MKKQSQKRMFGSLAFYQHHSRWFAKLVVKPITILWHNLLCEKMVYKLRDSFNFMLGQQLKHFQLALEQQMFSLVQIQMINLNDQFKTG